MEDAAGQWYYRLEKNRGVPTWPAFVEGVNKRFGPLVRSNPLGELTHLRRTGSVDSYQEQFLKLPARCEGVTEQQQIDIFTTGLLQPMSIDVELHKPETLEDAMALARAYERRTQVVDDGCCSLVCSTRSSSRHPGAVSIDTASIQCFVYDARRASQAGCSARCALHAPHARGDGAAPPRRPVF